MTEDLIDLYIHEVNELPAHDGVELIGDDASGNHRDNGLLIYKKQITLVRQNIIANAKLYRLNIYLIGNVVLNLKFSTAELLNKK